MTTSPDRRATTPGASPPSWRRLLLLLTGVLVLVLPATMALASNGKDTNKAPNDNSQADITVTFDEDCSGFQVESSKDISFVSTNNAGPDASYHKFEGQDIESEDQDPNDPDGSDRTTFHYSQDDPYKSIVVKSGQTMEVFDCPDGGGEVDPEDGAPECSDGTDNDEDGLTDHPDDPGCETPDDDDERDSQDTGDGCGERGDADGDGICDDADQCADSPAGEPVGEDGCPEECPDADGDGVCDDADQCADSPAGEPVGEDGCPPAGGAAAEAQLLNLGALSAVSDVVSNSTDTAPGDEDDEGILSGLADGSDLLLPPQECPLPLAAQCALLWETDNDQDTASTGVLLAEDENYTLYVVTSDCDGATLLGGSFAGNEFNLWESLNGGSGGDLGDGLYALSLQIQENGNVLVLDLGGAANDPSNDGPLGEFVVGHARCESTG